MNTIEIEAGDVVQVEDGPFRGCILTVIRLERGAFVLRRSTMDARAFRVTLIRKGVR